MMNISDILQIILVCALIFLPLGYLARHSWRRITESSRLLFVRPRYVKPAGTLRRSTSVKADKK